MEDVQLIQKQIVYDMRAVAVLIVLLVLSEGRHLLYARKFVLMMKGTESLMMS